MPNVTEIRNVWRRANSLLRLFFFSSPLFLRHCIRADNSCHWFPLYFYRLSQMNSDPLRRGFILEIKPLKPIFPDNLEKKEESWDSIQLFLVSSVTDASLCCFIPDIFVLRPKSYVDDRFHGSDNRQRRWISVIFFFFDTSEMFTSDTRSFSIPIGFLLEILVHFLG